MELIIQESVHLFSKGGFKLAIKIEVLPNKMEVDKDITDKLKSNGCNVLDVKHIKTYTLMNIDPSGYTPYTTNKTQRTVIDIY